MPNSIETTTSNGSIECGPRAAMADDEGKKGDRVFWKMASLKYGHIGLKKKHHLQRHQTSQYCHPRQLIPPGAAAAKSSRPRVARVGWQKSSAQHVVAPDP